LGDEAVVDAEEDESPVIAGELDQRDDDGA
jgi:hypothetical protein